MSIKIVFKVKPEVTINSELQPLSATLLIFFNQGKREYYNSLLRIVISYQCSGE